MTDLAEVRKRLRARLAADNLSLHDGSGAALNIQSSSVAADILALLDATDPDEGLDGLYGIEGPESCVTFPATEPKPLPAGMEERIEALNQVLSLNGIDLDWKDSVRITGELARAFAPELFDGRGWIAPWEATKAMAREVINGSDLRGPYGNWADMRDAYLKEQEKKP